MLVLDAARRARRFTLLPVEPCIESGSIKKATIYQARLGTNSHLEPSPASASPPVAQLNLHLELLPRFEGHSKGSH